MYEYDVYADARRSMPRLREPLQAIDGEYFLVKSDILAHTMTFSTSKDSMSNLVTIPVSRVREILAVNRNGGKVETILGEEFEPQVEEPTYRTEEDSITRFDKSKKRKKRKNRNSGSHNGQGEQNNQPQETSEQKNEGENSEAKAGQESNNQGQNSQQGAQRHNGQRNHHQRSRGGHGGHHSHNNRNNQGNQNKQKQE